MNTLSNDKFIKLSDSARVLLGIRVELYNVCIRCGYKVLVTCDADVKKIVDHIIEHKRTL